MPRIKTALVSVSNKEGIVDLVRELVKMGIKILSTGGTARILKEARLPIGELSKEAGISPMLGGRVKTLHPNIHAGILTLRDNPQHIEEMKALDINLIDMVVVNFYPFTQVITKEETTLEQALENIDIGGPAMLRSAAKNFHHVAAVSSPEQYAGILKELRENESFLKISTCRDLAMQVFQITASYNGLIANYLGKEKEERFPEIVNLNLRKMENLRYGENPHQRAAFYVDSARGEVSSPLAQQISGKKTSFNNLLDLDAALGIVREFTQPAAVIIKHTNPCGLGCAPTLPEAYQKALSTDPVSAFGSIVGLNRAVDRATALEIASPNSFIEGIIAPDYEEEALQILKTKQKWGKNVCILKTGTFSSLPEEEWNMKKVEGGYLLQDEDRETHIPAQMRIVSQRKPSSKEKEDLLFAWKIVKWVKSNAIVLAKNTTVVGVGAGQMSRIDSTLIAIRKASRRARGSVLGSDAFMPFPDVVERAEKAGITAIIQPGGALRDKEVIKMANQCQMAMLFTGIRHFRH
ncbi:bifunctional phosphoribosylaminoimidazolecarboxamide formyltransferase/IMP cyclohydrolase [Candidatus Aerophobetes bacterium]|uniref:Bifunctional purine biosynthesis protein PurH n=1 Tax=Aerophobetes bacterium TaxID=2030807 RepID=A0A523TEP5_UNCAE|nr:MAG: bifunctional phosphoribosylaminoimidazolecarboxamide formyltransferase/IMP cyclohydrolase [Candidatus Aerophobetes bacterium]